MGTSRSGKDEPKPSTLGVLPYLRERLRDSSTLKDAEVQLPRGTGDVDRSNREKYRVRPGA